MLPSEQIQMAISWRKEKQKQTVEQTLLRHSGITVTCLNVYCKREPRLHAFWAQEVEFSKAPM